MTMVVPAGPRNSVGLDRGFRSMADLAVMVALPFVTEELEGDMIGGSGVLPILVLEFEGVQM